MRKSSRGVLEEKKRHKALLEQVSLVPRTETSRCMWMAMHMDVVLMEGVTCDTVREFVWWCDRKGMGQSGLQKEQSNVGCMVALGLHACSHRVRDVGYWFGLEGDGVRFISSVWMCGLGSWILHMVPWFEEKSRFFLSTCVLDIVLLHSDLFAHASEEEEEGDHRRDRIVLDFDGVELVCCSLHFVIHQVLDGTVEDVVRLVGLIDSALMVLSGIEGALGGLSRWQKRIMMDMERMQAWIDEQQCDDGPLESALWRLKSRMMLFEYVRVSDATRHHDGTTPTLEVHEEVHKRSVITMMHVAFDSVLYWNSSLDDVPDEYVAYACWSVSNTLFLQHGCISNGHPSPVADHKIACNTLERLVATDRSKLECEALDEIACWALSSRVDDVHIQQQIVDLFGERMIKYSSSSAHVEFIEDGHVSLKYEWLRHQMLLMGNKLAVDDTSVGGIVVGQQLEAKMRSIRNLVFPAVLLCPYSLLHKVFNAGVTNRNEVWIVSSICEVFPNLVHLRPVDCPRISANHQGTELSRLMVDRVIMSKGISEEEESSLLYMVEVLMNATPSILSLGMFRDGILSMLSSTDACPEFATKFVARILELSTVRSVYDLLLEEESSVSDTPYAVAALERCLYYLEFDNRYQSLGISTHDAIELNPASGYFDKSVLQNIQDIVLLIADCLMECDASSAQHILTTVEYQGHPWARLYFGIDFTEDEAHYILKLNPKPSHLDGNCFGVKNTALHQAFELAALGSIQAQMLKHLAHEYKSMEDLRADIVRSVSCIASVCTSSEAQHLLHGVEVIAGDACIGQPDAPSMKNPLTKPYIIQACTRAIVAEIGMKSVYAMVDHTYTAQASMVLSDVGRYCLQSIAELPPSTSSILALRLFGEVLGGYTSLILSQKEKRLHPNSMQSSSIEAIISSLAQGIIRRHSRALSDQENTIIVNRAFDMVSQAHASLSSLNDTHYITALRSLFKT